jgi:hypothetical protein
MEYKNTLPGYKLPSPQLPQKNTENSKTSKSNAKMKIKSLVKEMTRKSTRTANFAVLVYIVENNFKELSLSEIKEKIKEDHAKNDQMFINSFTKEAFRSEKKVLAILNMGLARNQAFIIKEAKDDKYVSLDYTNALKYLNRIYKKYMNDDCDVSSLTSAKSPRKISYKSEKKEKKFLGNKTSRKNQKKKMPNQFRISSSIDSFGFETEEKSVSTYKYLKENLKPKTSQINNIKKINNKKIKEEKENDTDDIFNKGFSFHIKGYSTENFASKHQKEITNSLNSTEEAKKIMNAYINKLKNIKSKVEERDKEIKEFKEKQDKLSKEKRDLIALYQALKSKYDAVSIMKNSKYFGDIFGKYKKNLKLYKNFTDSKIKNFKLCFQDTLKLEKSISEKDNEIFHDANSTSSNKNIKNIKEGNEYLIKKDYSNIVKNIKENYLIENNNEYCDENNKEIVNEIIENMNQMLKRIQDEK